MSNNNLNDSSKKVPLWKRILYVDEGNKEETVSEAAVNLASTPTKMPYSNSVPITTFRPQSNSVSTPTPTIQGTLSQAAQQISANNAMKDDIMQLIKDNNIDGFDYYEFMILINKFSSIPVLSQRYTTAFETSAAMGMSFEHLISTAKQYQQIVKADQTDFSANFTQRFEEDVNSKRIVIVANQHKMQELSDQINKLNEECQTLIQEADEAEQRLTLSHTQYVIAGDSVIKDIDTELTNINTYLTTQK